VTVFSRCRFVIFMGLLLASLTARAASPVVVSSKIDTEGAVLGNLILLSLKDAGIPVKNRIQLGATSIVRKAIIAGEIDIYPEYTGNGAFFFHKKKSPVWKHARQGYETVKKLDYQANKIVWLTPAPANNTWAMSVRGDLARAHHLKTLDDLAKYINGGGHFKFAASSEFVNSPAALPAFEKAYGFKLKPDQLVILSGGNTAATIRAAALKGNGINGAMTYGTDGGLNALDLRVMQDTKGVQPVYEPAPIVRESVLKAYPRIRGLLAPVFKALDLQTLQRLNADVAVKGEPASQVARRFLDNLKR